MDRPRVLVAGSCVARDTVEAMRGEVDLLAYVARQSWISAVSPTTALLRPTLASPFQQRMVDSDLGSGLGDVLRSHADDVDLLLIDLTDERLGVLDLPDGSSVTWSQELRESGAVDDAVDVGALAGFPQVLEFGTQAHRARFASAADTIVALLEELDLVQRTLQLHTPWAPRTSAGEPVRGYMGRPSTTWNPVVAEYAGMLASRGVATVELPADLALNSPAHRWGTAPYHYTDEAYAFLTEHIRRRLEVPPRVTAR